VLYKLTKTYTRVICNYLPKCAYVNVSTKLLSMFILYLRQIPIVWNTIIYHMFKKADMFKYTIVNNVLR